MAGQGGGAMRGMIGRGVRYAGGWVCGFRLHCGTCARVSGWYGVRTQRGAP